MTRRSTDMAIIHLRDIFGLTIAESNVLATLASGGIISHTRIIEIYCDQPFKNSPLEAHQCVKRIRKKVRATAPHIRIRSVYGEGYEGYELEGESLKVVREIMKKAPR